jgi:hypothetical protein
MDYEVLFGSRQSKAKKEANENQRQDIMVDGSCPRKSVRPSQQLPNGWQPPRAPFQKDRFFA